MNSELNKNLSVEVAAVFDWIRSLIELNST